MEGKKNTASGIPQRPERNRSESEYRVGDIKTLRIQGLFSSLIRDYGENARGAIMKHIEKETGGTAQSVVERCLNGETTVHDSIRNGIIFALESYRQNNPPSQKPSLLKDLTKSNLSEKLSVTTEIPPPGKSRLKRMEASEKKLEVLRQRARERRTQKRRKVEEKKVMDFIAQSQKPKLNDEEYARLVKDQREKGKIT